MNDLTEPFPGSIHRDAMNELELAAWLPLGSLLAACVFAVLLRVGFRRGKDVDSW